MWPGIGSAASSQLLALQWQLDQSEWWSRDRLLEHQFEQIRALVAHAIRRVPYYESALRESGVSSLADLDHESFRRWPILRKADVRANEEALRTSFVPRNHGAVFESQTTGSTAMPVRIYRTALENLFAQALTVREHLLHGRDFSRKFATIRAGVEKSGQDGWGVASVAFKSGRGCALSLYEPVERQLEWLLDEKPGYLLSTPLNLRQLVLLSREKGLAPQGLLQVTSYAAMQPAGLKKLVRETWDVELTDTYSCTEAATLAVQCPGHDHYLVQAENVYLEVLREDGSPCTPGETGRVVITPLHNFAMPLIRYELGDYAELGGSCPTGRGLPTLNRIAGRVRNLMHDPNGRICSPNIPPELWLNTPITQYQLVQRSVCDIEVRYVTSRDLSAAEIQRLAAALAASLGYPFGFRFERVRSMERPKGGKYEEFMSMLAERPEGG